MSDKKISVNYDSNLFSCRKNLLHKTIDSRRFTKELYSDSNLKNHSKVS